MMAAMRLPASFPSISRAFRRSGWRGLALWLSLGSLALPAVAAAHGGLPVAQQILWRQDTMMVPTPYWGIFVGTDGGPWRWICDEAINLLQTRRVVIGSDGQYLYATDRVGLTVSPDGGCTWKPATGDVAMLDIAALATDPSPSAPRRVYALANSSDSSKSGLWRSEDGGGTWTLIRPVGMELPSGLAVSADGKAVAVVTLSAPPRQPILHLSTDGGSGFTSSMLDVATALGGQAVIGVVPLSFDGPTRGPLYLRVSTDAGHSLFRFDGLGVPTKLLDVSAVIYGVARDPQSRALVVATGKGLYQQQADQSFQALSTVSMSQCVSEHGSSLYACSWNYAPDLAAVGRLSDMNQRLTKVFQYHDTKGPLDCGPTTNVGQICPSIWLSYAEQLGVMLPTMEPPTVDPPKDGCQCSAPGKATPLSGLSTTAAMAALLGLLLRRRARLQRS